MIVSLRFESLDNDSEEKNDIRKKNQDNQNNEYTSKVVVNNNLM